MDEANSRPPGDLENGCKSITGRWLVLLLFFALALLSTYFSHELNAAAPTFGTFREIPGITDDEIEAIEALQARNVPLIYATARSTELFENKDGTLSGYTVLFCEWLSGMIGIPIQVEVHSLPVMIESLDSGAIDLATVSATPERLAMYSMSGPIVQRVIKRYRYEGSPPLAEISRERLPRYAFTEGSAIIQLIADTLEAGTYEEVIVANEYELYQAVRNGEADVFILVDSFEAAFDQYEGIYTEDFLPLTHLHASVAASNPDYDAVISVITKALQHGAAEYLAELHRQGYQDYRRHKFSALLNDEEAEYLRDNPVIPFATQYASYPTSFFNAHEGKWDGIVFDILDELRWLTGLNFEMVHDSELELPELMALLENETAYFMPNLIHSPERAVRFDWLHTAYLKDRYALLSKQSYPNVELNDILTRRVGVISDTAFAEAFRTWFPDALYVTEYPIPDDAFMALDKGEVDLVMSIQSRLAALTNYYELSDYKANYLFNEGLGITFALNKNQTVLRSIFEKSLPSIDTDRISEQWMSKTYNIETMRLRAQRPWLIGTAVMAVMSSAVLVFVIVLFYKNRKASMERAIMREADERTKLMLDSAPIGIIFVDKDVKIIDCNEKALEMFGVADRDVFMANFHTYSPEFQPDGNASADATENIFGLIYDEGGGSFEWMHQKPDGEFLPCEVTYVPLMYKGELVSIAYMRDLSEARAAAEKILEIEEEKQTIEEEHRHLAEILDTLPVGIRILSLDDWTLLYSNQACLDVFGCSSFEEQVKGRSGLGFMPEIQPDGRATAEHLAEINEADRYVAEIQCFKLDGQPFICRITSIKTNYAGHRASLAAMEDVTAQLEHQERLRNTVIKEQEANQLKSRFLAQMSHEIRTPMNAILGITEIELQNESLPSATVESLGRIFESGNLLLNIINDILDLSKIEAGKLEIVPVKYDIPSLINDAVQVNRIRYESKPIDFFLDIDENTPFNMLGDELRLRQILNNILSNAYKYTDRGSVRLSVSSEAAKSGEDDGVTLILQVSDTGWGMTEEQLDKLFVEYTRFNFDAKKTAAGTGLGMSITKRLLDLMGGAIYVESEPGKGSVFTVRIPQKRLNRLVCGPETAEKIRDFRFHSISMTKRSRTTREYMPYGSVLVVDDVESNIYVTKGMLLPYGLRVDSADSGPAAIEKIKAGSLYDIIFMDHMMPEMDGIEAAKILRGMGYKNNIIALTANALVGQAKMFLENGFDGYISKPIDSRELNAILIGFIRDQKPPEVVEAARREQPEKRVIEAASRLREDNGDLPEIEECFLLDAENAVNVLERICGKPGGIDETDVETYEITLHGMKSALANIKEAELSGFALKLEQAALEKNIDIIRAETPAFRDALCALIKKLQSAKGADRRF